MPVLHNARHEKFAQGIVKGLTADAAYQAAGYKQSRPAASRLSTNVNVQARVEELQTAVASEAVLSARWCVDELAKNHARAVAKGDLTNSNRALELIGRFFRAWNPEDAGDQQADYIPWPERLAALEREEAIDQADDKVVRLSRDQPEQERSA